MKRSSLLFFALIVLLQLTFLPAAYSGTEIQWVSLSRLNDADGNGYTNFNDVVRIQAVATYTGAATAWLQAPTADCTSLGLGPVPMSQTGNLYTADVRLTEWKIDLNYDPVLVSVYAQANDNSTDGPTNSNYITVDLCQVAGANPTVSPLLISNSFNTMAVSIEDSKRQSSPGAGTTAYVNLASVGGPTSAPLIWNGTRFENTFPAIPNQDYSGPATITVKDPLHPSVSYPTNNFVYDTRPPVINAGGTTVQIMSGNATALSGDILRLTLTVDNYDNDTASVTIAGLTAAGAEPDDIVNGLPMPLVSSVAGGQAVWRVDVELASTTIKNNAMTVVFAATDNAGNITTVNRTFAIDLDVPAINPLTVECLGDGQETRADPYDLIATATCWLKFDANVPINVGPDILTVTIDLSPIGGNPAVVMDNHSGYDYRYLYQIPPGSIEDSVIQTFQVTARDVAGNTIYKTTTPPIRIDNSMPAISSAVLSCPDGKITVGSIYTITVTATGVETGTVTVDLSDIGSGTNQVLKPVPSMPNTYRETFILPNSRVSGKARDGLTGFPVVVSDIVASDTFRIPGHSIYGATTQMVIDNEPPVLTEVATFAVDAPKNWPHVIIGDDVRLEVSLASTTGSTQFDGQRVFADLSSAGLPANQELILSSGLYTYTFKVATGSLNLGATFPISIADDDGNKAVLGLSNFSVHTASVTIPLFDQNPPDPGVPTLTVTRRNGQIADPDDSTTLVNTHKELLFRLPFTREAIDDHATAAVNLRLVPSVGKEYLTPELQLTSSSDLVKFSDSDTSSYSLRLDVASFTEADKDRFEYPTAFTVYMYDRSGNVVVTTTNPATKYRADCFPPAIASLSATPANGSPALIGHQIHFRVKTLHNIDEYDGNNRISPVIDLTTLGYSNTVVMNPDPLDTDWYEYFATVNSGSFNGNNASWAVTLRDGGRNFVSSHTPVIQVDNQGPIIAYASASWQGMPGPMKLGINASFTVKINEPILGLCNATIDLSPIGGGTAVPMTGTNASFSILTTTAQTDAEFSNYRFKITISDQYGNSAITETNQVLKIDCQPPVFESHGIEIFETNGDNPQPTAVSNLNDVIVVFASISAALDATPVATIGSSTGSIATATMVFNAGRDRHEAFFTVASSSTRWGDMNGTMTYHISCPDDVLNPAIPPTVTGESTFKVKNKKPSIVGLEMWLNPNNEMQNKDGYYVLNVASGSPADLLLASATLADDAIVTSAFLDLSAIPGAPAKLAMTEITGSVASTPVGIDLSSYAKVNYSGLKTFWVTLYDEAGNSATASKTFYVDTKRPAIKNAEFDGTIISVSFSEEIATPSPALWRLVGSTTAQTGTTASMSLNDLSMASSTLFFESYDFDLGIEGRKVVAGWASTPLYLEIIASDVAAITDEYGNWLPPANRYPVTITDSSFREPAKISSMFLSHDWPNATTLQITFNKVMSTYAASAAVLFVDQPSVTEPFVQVDFNIAYYFNSASDTFSWNGDNTILTITLCNEGRDWVARKLTNGSKTIKFAQRSINTPFARDDLGRAMTFYPYNNPVVITDNRTDPMAPTLKWYVKGNPEAPRINLSAATLDLTFTDRAWLFSDDYTSWIDTVPELYTPQPPYAKGSNAFQGKIHFYDRDSLAYKSLNFETISSSINSDYASTTVRLKLTEADINNILSLYNLSANRNWGLKVDAGAFTNLWSVGNGAYLDTTPGSVQLTVATPVASVAAPVCAVSDMPPVKEDTGNFIFEFEIVPATTTAGIIIPFSTTASPTAGIFLQSDDSLLASGTFTGWSNRTVNGVNKTIAAFKILEAFKTDVDYDTHAKLELFGLKDIFDNPVTGMVASLVYNRADRIATGNGFSKSPASFTVDNVTPTVVSFSPGDVIGRTAANSGEFKITFSEPMDKTAAAPVLVLASSTTTFTFSFVRWDNGDRTAVFKNLQEIGNDAQNGTWTYTVTGGTDTAGNKHVSSNDDVQVLSQAPRVASANLRTIQPSIDASLSLLNKPFNFSLTPVATLSITYTAAPTDNLPHTARFYNTAGNMIGSVTIDWSTGTFASATFSNADFNPPLAAGSVASISVKIADSAGNLTDKVCEMTYDASIPNLSSFTLTGAATFSQNIYYYNSLDLDDLTAIAASTATDPLRLTIASYPALAATLTFDMNYAGNHRVIFGKTAPKKLAPDTYSLGVADAAGNLHTGAASITLVVDNASPTIMSISPASPSGVIGFTAARMATFTIVFSEPMEPAKIPVLKLATTTREITMVFAKWLNSTTAEYNNEFAIDTSYPAGSYQYQVTGGADLAANPLNTDGNFTLDVQSKGPAASVKVRSLQSDIFGTTPLTNSHYSTLVNPAGTATIELEYSSTPPLNWPHQLLVYGPTKVNVATLTITALPTMYVASFPGDPASWTPSAPPGLDGHYSFKLVDKLGNIGPENGYLNRTLYLDRASATIDTRLFNDGNRGTTVSSVLYYSPRQSGSATITLTTLASDSIRMFAWCPASASSIDAATFTFNLASSTNGLSHSGLFGGSLTDGLYMVRTADFAGNLSDNATSSFQMIVDNASPTVISVAPMITGAVGAGGGIFIATFSEPMNPAFKPVVRIASTTATASVNLTSAEWLDPVTCRFTAATNIDDAFAPGTYSYLISGARDYAGNDMVPVGHGSFTIEIYSRKPKITTATLTSRQSMISGDQDLTSSSTGYFSPEAAPKVATLTVTYSEGPYSTPHQLRLYDAANVLRNTVNLTASGSDGVVSVDYAFFGNPGPGSVSAKLYSFTVLDSLGNYSATSTLSLIYDALGPEVGALNVKNVSPASAWPVYYHNPSLKHNSALYGNLTVEANTNDASGPLRLLLGNVDTNATFTWPMTQIGSTGSYTFQMPPSSYTGLLDGTYGMTIVDGAGNFASGTASTAVLIIDRVEPVLTSAQLSNGTYLSSGAAGAATFTLTFNEPLYKNAIPTLSIATLSASIPCVCATFSGNIATFTTAAAVTNALPQGEYTLKITATDLTGNVFNGASGTVQVRSRGPVIAAWHTTSQQFTTASGSETLINQPFSFNVVPGAATLSVTLQALPEGLVDDIRLHFTSAGTTVASYPLAWSGLVGTFTWNAVTGPATATAYNIYLYDGNNDASLETMVWELDNTRPTVASLTISGGEVNHASATVYYNSQRHSGITTRFQVTGETAAPKLRIRSLVSTDTYELQAAGTGFWSTTFTGKYSRVGQMMPDGIYKIGLADRAGNMAASGTEDLYTMIIDTQNPNVSTYTASIAGQPITWFAPSAGNLEIAVTSTDSLTASGVYYIDIINTAGVRVNRLPLVASGAIYVATWNGLNAFGNLVGDGEHTFRASDYAGNTAEASIKIAVITSEFKATRAIQISKTSAEVWFNHELAGSSVTAASVGTVPGTTITSAAKSGQFTLTFNTSSSFTHDQLYTISLATGTTGVRNIYGSTLASTTNQVSFKADGRGPSITTHSFIGLSGQKEVKIIFDETIASASANRNDSYTLKDTTGNQIAITLAAIEPDQKSVKLTTAADLVDSQLYTITASGATDIYGNPGIGNAYQFAGRDLTPPTIHVSAFSNPANVYDIIVIASTSEKLAAAPTLYVKHGNASAINLTMQVHSNQQLFMAGVSLRSSKAESGSLTVVGEDPSGNQGRGEGTFTIAKVNASIRAQVVSADQVVELAFAENSLKEDAVVKILKHQLYRPDTASQTIAPAMQKEMKAAAGLRSATVTGNDIQNSNELSPVSEGYEISIEKEKVAEGFGMTFKAPATATTGLALFNQSGNSWKFVTAATNGDGAFTARLTSSQIMAVMHDLAAPRINMTADLDFSEPVRTARPEFRGQIEEYGAGLDPESLFVTVDGGTAQPLSVDSAGNFIFKPLSPLTNGDHELVINASDRTGNRSQSAAIRFQVALPLQIGQIMQYPNPARNRGFIRISANSKDLTDELVTIKIYDTAGHKVTSLGGVRAVKEDFTAGGSRYLYDIPWDLRNEAGKTVANGVYIARIEVRDPLNPAQKVKKTCKLAVLR